MPESYAERNAILAAQLASERAVTEAKVDAALAELTPEEAELLRSLRSLADRHLICSPLTTRGRMVAGRLP